MCLTARRNQLLKVEEIDLKFSFRLPRNQEWEYAATCIDNKSDSSHLFGGPHPKDWFENNYLAKYGQVIEVNHLQLKDRTSDGHFYTSPVAYYAPNKFGLYDLSGNVSEWLSEGISQIYENH